MLFKAITTQIGALNTDAISLFRKNSLQSIINYIKHKADHDKPIQLNFICTHNSRRSHLSQVWAQALALYFNIKRVYCYSGGTETTAFYPAAAKALESSGFKIESQLQGINPLYKIKYAENQVPIMGFSKTYDDDSNPKTDFAAILTCSQADKGCPFIPGAEVRIPMTFDDPKVFDNTPLKTIKYLERSLQIATELKYIFSNIKH